MFSKNFLTALARKHDLSPEQEEVFLLWILEKKTDQAISEKLHVTQEAIRSRKTGIYKKFGFPGKGSNKEVKLRNWLEAEARKQDIKPDVQTGSDDLEALVQEVRQKIAADVTERCGTMRVLDMTQPVDLEQIYTDVNILKDVIGRRRIGYDEVMEVCSREHFDRFLVGTIQKRVTGLEAVEEIKKLVVLGKPGAGKTTFMKYLAMSCLGEKFHGELVPIFVTLKVYAETKGTPTLQEYIFAEFQQRKVSREAVERLLEEGKALILLDGLDEVKLEDDRRVKQDIDKFSRDWLKNRFAITCRIAAREYQFEKFTDVEVADFDDGQIKTFINDWFREKDEAKAARMWEKLQGNEPVKELATNPLLLTLFCLVFEKTDNLREKRSDLYKEGLDIFLKYWDEECHVERDVPRHFKGEQIYKELSIDNKKDMLGSIALLGFTKDEYLFRQEDLQHQIKDYIYNLPEVSTNTEVSRLDSEAVLKAIEHHHGLLVERARNIYSFSHLTFQEYFTAREIERERKLEDLMQHLTEPRWQEVFLLTAEMLRRSDDFLHLMKTRIDEMLVGDETLQALLQSVVKKTDSVKSTSETSTVKWFYFDLFREFPVGISSSHNRHLYQSFYLDLCLSVSLLYNIDFLLASFNLEHSISFANNLGNNVLQQVLQRLQDRLPDRNSDQEIRSQWWENNGEEWRNELRQVCIEHRNIGHDWQFTDEQKELLKQYSDANLLLVQCMNRSYASKEVREEIEATLLLPREK